MSDQATMQAIMAELVSLRAQVAGFAHTTQLAYSSLENGSLAEYNAEGQLVQVLGKQFDGTHTIAVITGPVPPQPVVADVFSVAGGMVIRWNGDFTDGGVLPMDFSRVAVYVGTFTGFNPFIDGILLGTFENPRGAEMLVSLPPVEQFVVMFTISQAGVYSASSSETSTTPLTLVDIDEINALLEPLNGLPAQLADAEAAVAQVELDVASVQNIADSKSRTYYQDAPPASAGLQDGYLWFDTNDGYKPYRWDGTNWLSIRDGTIATAQSAATAASSAASTAQTAAETAATNAATAQSAATAAQSTASTAVTNAATAQTAANTATTNAATAQAAAVAASGLAGGKSVVVFQTAAPTGSALTLWIDTTGGLNTPKKWSGSAWVAVTDKTATDAAAAAVAAQNTANTATTAAATAQTQANTATTNAATAQTQANTATTNAATAQSAAVAAQSTANTAVTNASTAQSRADTAFTNAGTAQTQANTATTNAAAANTAALDAAGLASTKGVILFQTTAPTGDVKNLWIDTTSASNTPKRWNGSAWVAVTDKVATSAASAAATAQSQANTATTNAATAQAAAVAAQSTATAAQTAAGTAQSTADDAQAAAAGKSAIYYSASTPSGVGTRAGDVWFQRNAGGGTIGQWEWDGSAWQSRHIEGLVIANIDAGDITAGSLSAARIAANTIVASHITAGTITGDKLKANTITATQIGSRVITAAEIYGGTITAAEIATNAITAVKIAANAVTAGKIAALAVTAGTIAANAITATEIAAGTITATEIAVNAITGKTITGGTITGATVVGGVFKTATSGRRIEINSATVNQTKYYSGAAGETPGYISVDVNGNNIPQVQLRTPSLVGGTGAFLVLTAEDPGAANPQTNINISAASGSIGPFNWSADAAGVPTIDGGLTVTNGDATFSRGIIGNSLPHNSAGIHMAATGKLANTGVIDVIDFTTLGYATSVLFQVNGNAGYESVEIGVTVAPSINVGSMNTTTNQYVQAAGAKWATIGAAGYFDIPANTYVVLTLKAQVTGGGAYFRTAISWQRVTK